MSNPTLKDFITKRFEFVNQVEEFDGYKKFREWIRKNFLNLENPLYLVDIRSERNSNLIDIIEEFGLKEVVIICSPNVSKSVINLSKKLGMKILPDSALPFLSKIY